MKKIIGVRGTQITQPKEFEVNVDTVYSRENIKRIETDDFTGWEYDEIQYSLREYQEKTAINLSANTEYLVDVDFRLTIMEMGM